MSNKLQKEEKHGWLPETGQLNKVQLTDQAADYKPIRPWSQFHRRHNRSIIVILFIIGILLSYYSFLELLYEAIIHQLLIAVVKTLFCVKLTV